MIKKNNNGEKRSMSYQTKWIITLALVVIAVALVVICISQGMLSFKSGVVTPNDKNDVEGTEVIIHGDEGTSEDSQYTVFVSEGNGGSANPSGRVTVDAWGSITVSFTPNEGYEIQSVVVDGEDMGPLDSYTLSYITADHTIMVTFEKIPEPTPEPTPDIPEEDPEE